MVRSLSADCRRLVLLALVSVGCLLSSRHIFAADADSAGTTPSGAVFFAEVAGLDSWIDKLRHSPLVASLAVNPQVQAFYASPQGRKALAGRVLIEGQVGMDLWTLAKAALGGRVSVALYPHEGRQQPDAVIAVQVNDVAALNKIRERREHWQAERRDPALEVCLPMTSDSVNQLCDGYAALGSPVEAAIGHELVVRLEAAFDRLPERYREMLTLSRILGLSHTEIADQIGKSEGAVRTLLSRALVRLSALLDEEDGTRLGSGRKV